MEERKFLACGQENVISYIKGELTDRGGEVHIRGATPFRCLLTTHVKKGEEIVRNGTARDLVPTLIPVTTNDSHGALLEFWEPGDDLFTELLQLNGLSLEALGITRENNLHLRMAERKQQGERCST